MKWTQDQLSAIHARGQNLLLAAAAGSGKTTVLVERVAALGEGGADIREMLPATFTRAPAADMRMSLIKRPNALAADDPRFRQQAEYAEFASISTIHSFCTDLLRAFFQAAGVDPAFRIADGTEAGVLRANALQTAMNIAYETDSDDHQALCCGRKSEDIAELTLKMHDFLMERPDPWGWLDERIQSLESGQDDYTPALIAAAQRYISDACAIAEYAFSLCKNRADLTGYLKTASADLELIDSLFSLDYEALRLVLKKPPYARKPTVKGAKDKPDCVLYDSLRKQMKNTLEKAADCLPLALKPAVSDLPECAKELRALRDIVKTLDEEYTRLKDEKSLLTFTDLERRALKVLSDEEVRRAMQEKFKYVFVDEYQDVSDVQEAILSKVARENGMFSVGDVKQSIYRFRHAEPTLFMGKYDAYREDEGGHLIVLNQNFRSRRTVLEYTNHVFTRAMHGGESEIVYDDAAKLYAGAQFEGEDAPVEIHLIDKSDRDRAEGENADNSEAAQLIADMKDAETEALLVAKRIRSLRGKMIWDGKKGVMRPLQWRDFVILTRQARDVAQQMLSVLRREGIPAYADVSGGYLDVMEVQLALALLRIVENRRRDAEWIAVLRSPCMNLNSSELARIRARFPKECYAEAVRLYSELQENQLSDRLKGLLQRVSHWRALSGAMPLSQLIYMILSESNLYSMCGALPGGSQRQANLDILCDRAAAYEANHAGGLTGFLGYIEDMNSVSEDMGEAHILGENDDVVRIMTVHKSKGLEFPVVFGVLLGRKLGGGARRSEMITHRNAGIGMKHMDTNLLTCRETLPRLAAQALTAAEEAAEELRILYVMLTRARDRLILIGCVKDLEVAIERYKMGSLRPITPTCYLDLLLPPVCSLPGGEELRDGELIEDETLPKVELHMHSRRSLMLAEEEEAMAGVALMDKYCAEEADGALVDAYNWQYPYEDAVLLPLKLTASGISRELVNAAQPPELIPRPQFLAEEQGLSGAERGTAAHAALQGLDLDAVRLLEGDALHASVVRQLNAMTESGQLTRTMREAVRPMTLIKFLESDLGMRMRRAEVLRREWMFTLKMSTLEAVGIESNESLLMMGSVDCCFEEDGQWVLLDYKTDRTHDEAALLDRYTPQLTLYARALERITGKSVKEVWLCLLSANRQIAVDVSRPIRPGVEEPTPAAPPVFEDIAPYDDADIPRDDEAAYLADMAAWEAEAAAYDDFVPPCPDDEYIPMDDGDMPVWEG